MRPTDYLVTHHRSIAHAVAKGVPLGPLVAEVLGKASGMNGGHAGEMHMSHMPSRFVFCWQLVGTCVPVAAGVTWAVKNLHKPSPLPFTEKACSEILSLPMFPALTDPEIETVARQVGAFLSKAPAAA